MNEDLSVRNRVPLALVCVSLSLLAGCNRAPAVTATAPGDLTSVGGDARQIDWDGFVYVAPDASDADIQATIARQVKSALGALREVSVGIEDRGALHNLDPAGWQRDVLAVVDAGGAVTGNVVRVRYHYRDTALVGKTSGVGSAFDVVVLFGDYTQAAAASALQPACVDEATDGTSLWYHFQPGQPACAQLVTAEAQAIDAAVAKLPPLAPGASAARIVAADAGRRFETLRAKLTPIAAAPTKYPEYDRLWGFGSDRALVVVYAFVGVESDEHDSHDLGHVEYQRLLRTLRQRFPKLAASYTNPNAWLLDYYVDGNKLSNVTWDDVGNWMIDDSGYPAAVGSDAQKREALRQQVVANFSERWIYWELPATVTMNGETRHMTVQLRTFQGLEDDGSAAVRQRAVWRYLEAFWYGDVFAYSGHSHFGWGPLEPTNYVASNFPDRYQVMLFNSCLSYNYYDLDFIGMHPQQSRELDVVMNGLPAYWNGMGESTGKYVIGLLDGSGKSWAQLLDSMRIDEPWGESGYEPMRGVNGELDNTYDPARAPISVVY